MKENKFTTKKENELVTLLYENPETIYTDYRDELGTHEIKKIYEQIEEEPNEDPLTIFKYLLNETYENYGYNNETEEYEYEEYAEKIGLEYNKLSDEDRDALQETVNENKWYEPDYDHFLNQDVCIDIIIDSGDYNWDLGCNQIYPHYDGDYEDLKENGIPKDSCILWLANKQKYTEKQTRDALADETFNGSKFLKTLQEELLNCTSHMNCLVFMKKMTIREWLESLNKKEITIPKETACGLVDFWSGAGGLLNIQLEQDITIPKENIHEIIPDECKRYNIHEIYGCTDRLWE